MTAGRVAESRGDGVGNRPCFNAAAAARPQAEVPRQTDTWLFEGPLRPPEQALDRLRQAVVDMPGGRPPSATPGRIA